MMLNMLLQEINVLVESNGVVEAVPSFVFKDWTRFWRQWVHKSRGPGR